MVDSTLLSVLNKKISKLAEYSFKNKNFGFDFIKKIIISIILEKPYYITVHELHIDSLKSIFKIFLNFNFFNIDMKDVERMQEIVGFCVENGEFQTIGFSPKAEIVVFDNIWNTDVDLIRNLSDLISTNTYSVENVMLESNTKIFIGTSSFETKPNLKYAKLWNSFFIKDQYISKIDDLDEMLDLDVIDQCEKIDHNDLNEINENYDDILIDLQILRKIMTIKSEIILANKPFENKSSGLEKLVVDDKSWDNIIKAIKISSFICGRKHVKFDDLKIIIPIVCSLPIQYDVVSKIISNAISNETKIALPIILNDGIDNVLVRKISVEILSEFEKIDSAIEVLKSHHKKEIKREKRLEIVRNNFNIFNAHGSLIDPSDVFNTYGSVDEIIGNLSINNWNPNSDLSLNSTLEKHHNKSFENKFETLVIQDNFLNVSFGNNKPKIYDDNLFAVEAKKALDNQRQLQKETELENIKNDLRRKLELKKSKRRLNLNTNFESIQPQMGREIDYNEILFGSYDSYRKMVLEKVGDLSFGDVETYRKPFTNLIDTFYLITEENETSFMVSSKYLDQISESRPYLEVPTCSKTDFFNNTNISDSKKIYFDNGKYYIKNSKNQKIRIIFSLSEVKNEFIFPSLISITLIQKFVREGTFLIDYFNDMAPRIKLKLNDYKDNKVEYNYIVNLLANFLIVRNKLKTFLKWIKNSNEIEGSVKIFLPEYSSL